MGQVKVSIENVVQFSQGVQEQNDMVQDAVRGAFAKIDQIQGELDIERDKVDSLLERLNEAISKIKGRIQEQQDLVNQLHDQLSILIANEPMPEEELVSGPDEYDDEGNLVSAGVSYYVETDAHSSWRSEVVNLESQLSEEEEKLSHYQVIEGQAEGQKEKADEQISIIENVTSRLNESREGLLQSSQEANIKAEECVEKLSQIQSVIQQYLTVKIGHEQINGRSTRQGFWSKVVFPGTTVSGMSVTKFAVARVPAMSTAFDCSPDWIRKEVSSFGNEVKVRDEECRSHYSPSKKRIYMDKRYDDDEYSEVFKHEFGHYIDDAHGWISQTNEFIQAYRMDCEKYSLTTGCGLTATNKMFSELMNGDSAKYDRCISDIMSATFLNDNSIKWKYYEEGLPFYQHDNAYWNRGNNRENEVFANLFAIYSSNNQEAVSFMQKHFPNADLVFRKALQ